jgi:YspA, cpYpsA-related SLOG family
MLGHTALSHAAIPFFDEAVIVAGTRTFNDYPRFTELLEGWIARTLRRRASVIFISGKAPSGPDQMIIRWCREHGRAWTEYAADWEDLGAPNSYIKKSAVTGRLYNARAGHHRNREMARVATRVVCFWDGVSPGTANMIEEARNCNMEPSIILINRDPEQRHGQASRKKKGDREVPS